MRQYKVIALSVGSRRGRKIYKVGEIVNESGFPPGIAEELVLKKFLQPITGLEKTPISNFDKKPIGGLNDLGDDGSKKDTQDDKDENEGTENKNSDLGNKILNSLNDTSDTTDDTSDKKKKEFPAIDDITKNQIIDHLKGEKIEFDYKDSKDDLYDLWVKKSK